MSAEQDKFFKQLLHTAIRGMVNRIIWGLSWKVVAVLLAIAIGAVMVFKLY
jgi:uncharacterized membrane protein